MDAIQGIEQNVGKIAPLAMLPFGIIQNILAGRQNQDFYKQVMAQEKATQAKLTPEAIAAGTAKLTAPLSTALQHYVGNGVQADLAQRGLAQSPGIYAEAMAQGLAPYAQKNQLAALEAYMNSVGQGHFQFPSGFRPPPGMDMTGIIRMLMAMRKPVDQTDGGTVSGLAQPQWMGGYDPNIPEQQAPNPWDVAQTPNPMGFPSAGGQ